MNVRPFLNPPISVQSFAAAVEGVAAAKDRAAEQAGLSILGRKSYSEPKATGFALMTPERRREVSSMGNRAARPNIIRNAMKHFGLSLDEFRAYGVIRAKGFSPQEAADIVIRSRRAPKIGES